MFGYGAGFRELDEPTRTQWISSVPGSGRARAGPFGFARWVTRDAASADLAQQAGRTSTAHATGEAAEACTRRESDQGRGQNRQKQQHGSERSRVAAAGSG